MAERETDAEVLPPGLPVQLRRFDPAAWFDADHPEPMLARYRAFVDYVKARRRWAEENLGLDDRAAHRWSLLDPAAGQWMCSSRLAPPAPIEHDERGELVVPDGYPRDAWNVSKLRDWDGYYVADPSDPTGWALRVEQR